MKNKIMVFICVLCVCATMVMCSLIVVKPSVLFRKPSGITVKGVSTQRVVSDIATWSVDIRSSVDFSEADKRNAFAEVAENAKKIVGILKNNGFADSEIKLSNVSVVNKYTQNQNGYDTNVICGSTAIAKITVQTQKFDVLEKTISNADKICSGAVVVTMFAPSYLFSKLEDLKLDLLAKATANAKARAETLAAAGNAKLGSIMSASQGVFQINQPLSTETSSYGMYDTETIEKDVRCVVNVEFAVEK